MSDTASITPGNELQRPGRRKDLTPSRVPFVGRWVSKTPGFLSKQPWIWPLFAAAMLAFAGIWVRGKIERAMEAQIATNLQTILDANVEALRGWAAAMRTLAEILAVDDRVRELVGSLVSQAQAQGTSPAALLTAPGQGALKAYLQAEAEARGFKGYFVLDTNLVVLASVTEQLIGLKAPPSYALDVCFGGQAIVTRPFNLEGPRPGITGDLRPVQPLMFAAAPIRSADGKVVAILGLRILPDQDFTRILRTAWSGASGETYAFDRAGLFLSDSRFGDQLKRLGLIPDSDSAQTILTLEARDPLVNLSRGQRSPKRRSELPLTFAVNQAISGHPGVDARGYRDYRGVKVAGAWTWLPDFDMGLVTQLDLKEAYAPVFPIRLGFWFMFGLLTAGSAVIFLLMRAARRAALNADQLGQYILEEEIGSGGFGTVYRARHALMRRPVAVKVLDPLAGETSIARFEREVQLTSQLSHPNTVAIYDYGHTPGGLFYYAMEYLEGLSLAALVEQHGPQPEGRVIHILRQTCAALAEAHARGLVHRDIKPHNILITRRGGIPDFVKVVDFGLVKSLESPEQLELTTARSTLGTPLYMAPEAVKSAETVEAPSDIYSLGAVGFQLLTGETVFSGTSLGEVILHQLRSTPDKPSARLKRPVAPDLEDLIMQCLAKDPPKRPTALALEDALSHCAASGAWDRAAAEEWWTRHTKQPSATSSPRPTPQKTTGQRMAT